MAHQWPLIKASVEAAELGHLADQIQLLEEAGIDGFHFDVKDGHFIPEISMGTMFVRGLRKYTSVPFDVHLWVQHPEQYIESFVEAGADYLVIHFEACVNTGLALEQIRNFGCKAGVAINPSTPVSAISSIISLCDEINVMTITPGVRGVLNDDGVKNIHQAAELAAAQPHHPVVQVDGAVSLKTRELFLDAGATSMVAGYPIFSRDDFKAAIHDLRFGGIVPDTQGN